MKSWRRRSYLTKGVVLGVIPSRRSTGVGPFRIGDIDPLPSMVLTSRRIQSAGAGCTSPCLARSITLCPFPDIVDLGNCSKGPSGTTQAAASSAKLTRETMVFFRAVQATRWISLEASQENGSPPPVGGSDLVPKSRPHAPLFLASEGLEPLQFSNNSFFEVLKDCAPSVHSGALMGSEPGLKISYIASVRTSGAE